MANVKQIYGLVNQVVAEGVGLQGLNVVDTQGLIALGDTILSSQTNTDIFMNSLIQRIGKTIIASRKYESRFKSLMQDDFEWGAILQKISYAPIEAQPDPSYSLVEGESIDHYKINKPSVLNNLFITETPYMFNISIQDEHLKEAFTSAESMGAFIEGIFVNVQNSIELSLENLGRTCLNNYIAEVNGTTRTINLLRTYNFEHDESLTVNNCMNDADFLRYVVEKIKWYSDLFEDANHLFSSGLTSKNEPILRHTPKKLQHMYVLSALQRKMETITQYAAFHDDYVKLENYEVVPYWQTLLTDDNNMTDGSGLSIKRASDGQQVEYNAFQNKVLACLFDERALGIYKKTKRVVTTPLNAFGLYYNTTYHLKEMYFNDLSEQFIVFTIE